MSTLIRGDKLKPEIQIDVLRRWVHRFRAPYVGDAEWLKQHSFYVKKDGTLDNRRRHCMPDFMADDANSTTDHTQLRGPSA
jgi:hypothetical protein